MQFIAIVNMIVLFIPGLNPARISGIIGKNVSLFTCGISWSVLTQNMGRAFNQGWISRTAMAVVFGSGIITIIAVLFVLINVFMMLGNLKLKNKGVYRKMVNEYKQYDPEELVHNWYLEEAKRAYEFELQRSGAK